MNMLTRLSVMAMGAALLSWPLASAPPEVPSYQRFLSPASPQEVVAARKVDRVAWVDYAEGKRNAYTAAAPLFAPLRLTNFQKDDGIMMSEIKISDDGSTVVFLRGEAPNRDGWAPNPSADPNGPEHAIWAAHTSAARRVAGGRCGQSRAGARWQLISVREGWTNFSRQGHTREACQRSGSRREGVHYRVGRTERSEMVARRPKRSRSSAPEPITASSWFTMSRRGR